MHMEQRVWYGMRCTVRKRIHAVLRVRTCHVDGRKKVEPRIGNWNVTSLALIWGPFGGWSLPFLGDAENHGEWCYGVLAVLRIKARWK